MTVFVPRLITHRIENQKQCSRFVAQVLSLDIVGFSNLANMLMAKADRGAETLAREMNATFAPIFAEITASAGEIVAITGDSVTAVFPGTAPQAVDQCAERLIDLVSTASTVSLTARVGIATGEISCFVTEQTEGRRIYGFDGAAMITAARAQSAAKPQTFLREPADKRNDPSQSLTWPEVADATIAAEAFLPISDIETRGYGEFRHAVTAFIRLPDEAVEAQIQDVLSRVLALRQRFRGVGARLDFDDKGRTLFLFWGAPLASEGDKTDALRFLLALQQDTDIPLQIGAAFGMVFAGLIGGAERAEYTCYGKIPNLAARLMMAARPNSIFVDAALTEAGHATFEFGHMRELELKGFSQPMPCHELNGLRATPLEETNDHIGRDDLLSQVLASLQRTETSLAVLIEGEPGIGKSHFLRAVRQRSGHGSWVDVRCSPRFDTGFDPIRQLLEGFLGPFETPDELAHALQTSGVETDARRFWALFESPKSTEAVDADEVIGQLSEAVFAVMQAPAFAETLILVEDLHWLDGASAQVLTRLIARHRRPGSRPARIILTSRPQSEKLGQSARVDTLVLPVMSNNEARALLENLLGGPVSRRLLGQVQELGQGNPLFIRQLALLLLKTEAVAQKDGLWRLLARTGDAALPSDVRSLLVARIDKLSVAARRIVNAASIFGRSCALRDLELLLDGRASLDVLTELAEAEILEQEGPDHISFHHVLLAESAYDIQLTSERALLHRRIYDQIRKGDGSEIEKGRHAEGAGEAGSAISHYVKAADAATIMAQPEMVSMSIARALELADPDAHRLRFDLLLKLESAYASSSDLQRRDWALSEIEALVQHIGAEAEVAIAVRTARKLTQSRRYQELIDHLEKTAARMSEIARPGDQIDLLIEHASAQMYLATEASFRRSVDLANEALEAAKSIGDRRSLLLAHRCVGLVHRYARDDISREHFEIALSLSNSPRDRLLTSKSYASVLMRQGDVTLALEQYSEILDHALDTGSLGMEQTVRVSMGHAALVSGEFREAEEQATLCQSLNQEIGSTNVASDALFIKMHAAIQLGHLSDALAVAEQTRAAGHMEGAPGESLQLLMAMVLYLLGRVDDAKVEFGALLERATSEGRSLDIQIYDYFLVQIRSQMAPTEEVTQDFERLIDALPNTQMTSRFIFYPEVLEDRRLWMLAAKAAHLARIGRATDIPASDFDETLTAFDECIQTGARLDSGPGRNILTSRWASNILTALNAKNDPRYDKTLVKAAAALSALGDLAEKQGYPRQSVWAEDIYRVDLARRASDAGLEI